MIRVAATCLLFVGQKLHHRRCSTRVDGITQTPRVQHVFADLAGAPGSPGVGGRGGGHRASVTGEVTEATGLPTKSCHPIWAFPPVPRAAAHGSGVFNHKCLF